MSLGIVPRFLSDTNSLAGDKKPHPIVPEIPTSVPRTRFFAPPSYAESVLLQLTSRTGQVIETLDTFLALPFTEYTPPPSIPPTTHATKSHLAPHPQFLESEQQLRNRHQRAYSSPSHEEQIRNPAAGIHRPNPGSLHLRNHATRTCPSLLP